MRRKPICGRSRLIDCRVRQVIVALLLFGPLRHIRKQRVDGFALKGLGGL